MLVFILASSNNRTREREGMSPRGLFSRRQQRAAYSRARSTRTSTRRLSVRPAAVAFDPTGVASPPPRAVIPSGVTARHQDVTHGLRPAWGQRKVGRSRPRALRVAGNPDGALGLRLHQRHQRVQLLQRGCRERGFAWCEQNVTQSEDLPTHSCLRCEIRQFLRHPRKGPREEEGCAPLRCLPARLSSPHVPHAALLRLRHLVPARLPLGR
jgi:hypothetical protein